MKLTGRDLADYLSKTNDEMIDMLEGVGIFIEDIDKTLTQSQIKTLKDFIAERKNYKEEVTENKNIYELNSEKIVIIKNREYKLLERIGDGGEGTVYKIDNNRVCKIYKKLDLERIEKLKSMIAMNFNCEGVCFPTEIVYNKSYEPIGFVMKEAKGIEIQKALMGKAQIEKYFPQFNKRDMVELSLTILEKIEYLHKKKIILGDINPRNILIVSPREVYFVDTDSYQIDKFACPVGTTIYTAPEIQKKNFNSFLRSYGNEYFSIATLLFMLMIPGKMPYSKKGGEDIVYNILNMDFAYPLKDGENENIPSGVWMYCWSHMPLFMKKAFYKTFKKGEEFNKERDRLDVGKWKNYIKKYLSLIDNGTIEKNDGMSLSIFPTRFKMGKDDIEYEEESKYRLIFRRLLNI